MEFINATYMRASMKRHTVEGFGPSRIFLRADKAMFIFLVNLPAEFSFN